MCETYAVWQVEFSPAVIGTGVAFYHQVIAAAHEGVMAKLLRSGSNQRHAAYEASL
jgi:ATP-dependent DNA ligase